MVVANVASAAFLLRGTRVLPLGKDFLPRLASALVLAPLALLAASLGGWLFACFLGLAALLILWEWTVMTSTQPKIVLLSIGGVALVAATILTLYHGALPGTLPVIAAALLFTLLGRPRCWVGAGVIYAAAAVVPAVALREGEGGGAALLWLFALVWGTDIGAYFCGRLMGGPKLWPRISPNKTWSGAIGGALIGTAAGLLSLVAAGWAPGIGLGATTLAASIASQCGDLFESAMKRRFGCKDSSALIPGHGGLMDRLDGFVAAALVGLLVGLVRDPGAVAHGLLGF
ncbi:phosphatidate cytidylyltransferase [Ancylobacter sp. 6x-1]|uniref:Phosphatidate cytidylyltransferase n=1 Tax=Ancylobacter crimeensis TaxID=2579147 RepID=A0ABT0D6S6_9HYPH|nr:phosphatidate cytidylyltransferase [Ancylobacter crimeensis]MCK0195650.1 phosphatidate cytidylyltransferase [Ancylobacter crimeensis]